VALQSLRNRALNAILATFGGLTAIIAAALLFGLNASLEEDLKARANVIGRALEQSVDVSVGARQQNEKQLVRGLEWLSTVGEELVFAIILTPDGKPIAGVGPAGPLTATQLARDAARPPGFMEIEHRGVLAAQGAEAKPDGADALDAIMAEEQHAAPVGDPGVRIMLTRQGQVLRQTFAVVFTGVVLCLIAIGALAWIARDTFKRVEPALEHARRMAHGDFREQLREDEYKELASMFSAMNGISQSLSGMIVDVRGLGDEVTSAVERIMGAAASLRSGADQGTRAVSVTEGAVAAMQKSVDETARRLTDLATTADASSRDTETIERTNAATGETVLTLSGEVERHARSLNVIGERAKALSRDARSVGEASEAARAAALRMQRTSLEGTTRATEAARLADDAMRDSQVGGKAIEDAVARINEIAKHAGTMEGNLRGLTERVQGMNPVLGAITDVTSRTSLLALNAGIIAAQAGERGAAFQVVVDELKSLASRTAQLTSTVEESVRTVLEQRGRTEEAAHALRRVVGASMEDAHRAGAALEAIRASTTQSQQVSASIAHTLGGQERDVKETLERIDVVDNAGRSVEATARALADEVRVLKEVADRVTAVSDDVGRASREQGELAARVGQVLALVSRQVRELTATQAAQHSDVVRVERSISEIRRFADDARAGAAQLEEVTERVRQKVAGLTDALHRFRTRS
jgi:methyl-accepting chemotaxis protein